MQTAQVMERLLHSCSVALLLLCCSAAGLLTAAHLLWGDCSCMNSH